MPTRNTAIIQEIVEALGENLISPIGAQGQLELHFADRLLLVAGDKKKVAEFAEELRLRIIMHEAGQVLDYIGRHKIADITIDQAEEVINRLFSDRFIEP